MPQPLWRWREPQYINAIAAPSAEHDGEFGCDDAAANRFLPQTLADANHAMRHPAGQTLEEKQEKPARSVARFAPQPAQNINSARNPAEPCRQSSQEACLRRAYARDSGTESQDAFPNPPKGDHVA